LTTPQLEKVANSMSKNNIIIYKYYYKELEKFLSKRLNDDVTNLIFSKIDGKIDQ
jgi:hypothetical protein